MLNIEENKNRVIELINSISSKREFNREKFINWLCNTDYFEAPASTKYHMCYRGGLCQHSLNVYDNFIKLVELKEFEINKDISLDSIIILSLFHDISKTNFYKLGSKNVKVYKETGSRHDDFGNFDWETKIQYEVIDDSERIIYGNHEESSELIIGSFIPLSIEESIAIKHHHGGFETTDYSRRSMCFSLMTRYKLAAFLHMADLMSTLVDENSYFNKYENFCSERFLENE